MTTPTPPPDVASWAALARSYRPAWVAARYGDRDPVVLEQAQTYDAWIGGDAA